ncbi:MAG TPA: acyltransferase [Verrucomicrobiae bacterium]|nr:acyltransferase [Verrucomicrobiae bacterium]
MRPQSGYIPTLDGWRAVAILGVIASHVVIYPYDPSRAGLNSISSVIATLGPGGVDVFFGLSGFLITWRLLEEEQALGSVSLKRFYIRRAFRILPAALAYLIVVGCLGWMKAIPLSPGSWVSSLAFARNYYPGIPGAGEWYTGHFWSLAIEEHFYLFWPLMLVVAGQRRARWIVPTLIAMVSVWRNIEFHNGYLDRLIPGITFSQRTDIRADGLLCGCLAALLLQVPAVRDVLKRTLTWRVFSLLAVAYVMMDLGLLKPHLVITMQAIALAFLIAGTVLHPDQLIGRVLESVPFRWIGRLSYSLYLWQQLFVNGTSQGNAPLGWVQNFPFNAGMMVVMAAASYYCLEKPLVRLGHRLARPVSDGRGDIVQKEDKQTAVAASAT